MSGRLGPCWYWQCTGGGISKHVRILFGVSSVGLGHVKRSLAIANVLKKDSHAIDWIAAEPVLSFLTMRGENLIEVSRELQSQSEVLERISSNGEMKDISKAAIRSSRIAKRNYSILKPCLKDYDILIQDEFSETLFSFMWEEENSAKLPKSIAITDYVRLETRSLNPLNRIVLAYANLKLRAAFLHQDLRIFADEIESIKSARLRHWVKKNFVVTGPIVEEVPSESREALRRKLFKWDDASGVAVFTVGGTSIGSYLLELALKNAGYIKQALGLHVAILRGPRVTTISTDGDAQIVPFTTDSMKYLKAADCVVTQAGSSSLNEIVALGTPCVTLPIGNHWEQQENAARFSRKFGFEVIQYKDLSRESLVDSMKRAMSRKYSPPRIKSAGAAATKAADAIRNLALSSG